MPARATMSPMPDAGALTLAAILTTAGATSTAALITGLIAMLKTLRIPGVDGNEPRVAALIALVLVVLALVAAVTSGTLLLDLPTLFAGFTAWYSLTRLSMSIHDDVAQEPRSLTNQSG